MTFFLVALVTFAALQSPSEPKPLDFTPEQMNPVLYGYQRAHFCSPYVARLGESALARYIGDAPGVGKVELTALPLRRSPTGAQGIADKKGLTEMWTDESALCDLARQRDTFYDSVWRDAVRFEAIINYKHYFAPALSGRIDLSDYAIDDGIVSKQMLALLTTDTANTFGAQNDDVMWWALAFLRAYEYDPSHGAYLKAAKSVFERIRNTPEQRVCGGGITWGAGTRYKNAITNALYLNLAVRLAGLSPLHSESRRRYLHAATVQADWLIDRSGLWVSGGVLADGLHFKGDICAKEPELTVWTYSQGVAMSGLAQLTLLTGRNKYADRAQSLLLRVVDTAQEPMIVSSSGILTEPSTSPSSANEDAQTFKGIFVAHLGYALSYFSQADRLRYTSAIETGKFFLTTNANAVWKSGRMHEGVTEFPFDWADSNADANNPANMRTTAAAIDLFNAAWSVRDLR